VTGYVLQAGQKCPGPCIRNQLLSRHAVHAWLEGGDTTRLAAATNPSCLRNPGAPVQWAAAQGVEMAWRQAAVPLFDWGKARRKWLRVKSVNISQGWRASTPHDRS
jgi:hypothetical protein